MFQFCGLCSKIVILYVIGIFLAIVLFIAMGYVVKLNYKSWLPKRKHFCDFGDCFKQGNSLVKVLKRIIMNCVIGRNEIPKLHCIANEFLTFFINPNQAMERKDDFIIEKITRQISPFP